jgi:transcriptional regulator with XRE-family HTH domain
MNPTPLQEWLDNEKIRVADLAEDAGVSRCSALRAVRGIRVSVSVAAKLAGVTDLPIETFREQARKA